MDNGKSVVFSAAERKLNQHALAPTDFNIYKYDTKTSKITRLTEQSGLYASVDWISDDAHAVSPVGKQPIQWGKLKAFLNSRIEALKVFSRDLSVFLSN